MSESQQTNPTVEDLTQIGTAAGEAVDPATQTPQQATASVRAAVEEKAKELRVTLEPEAVDAIATATISKLEQMGAFRQPEPPPAASENPEGEQVEQVAGTGSAAPPPERKTLAQKLLG